MTTDNGTAAENGELEKGTADTQQDNNQHGNKDNTQAVPYSRFAEVNAKRKAAEDALSAIVDGLCEQVPEDMRSLIPNLPPVERAQWLKDAQAKGLFSKQTKAPATSPDAKRPSGKQNTDTSGMNAMQKLQHAFGQK